MKKIRLDKYLADAGAGTRSEVKKYISKAQGQVNGKTVLNPAEKIEPEEVEVCCLGQVVHVDRYEYYLLHKPAGCVSATEDVRERTVMEFVPSRRKDLFPVGRLDKDSEGLLLMTNQGELVNQILKGRYGHEKEYLVTVNKEITASFLERMRKGVKILDTVTRPCTAEQTGEKSFRIILTQGLTRQIRRMCEALGYRVKTLKRVRIMNLELGSLKTGEYREITKEEYRELKRLLEGRAGRGNL